MREGGALPIRSGVVVESGFETGAGFMARRHVTPEDSRMILVDSLPRGILQGLTGLLSNSRICAGSQFRKDIGGFRPAVQLDVAET